MNVGFFVPVVMAAALASSCDDEDGGIFDSLRSESSIYYYNQITSQGADDQSNLTVDFTVEGDESDSVNNVGYSREDEAPELNVRIDDSENNEENAVQFRGANQNGATLFTEEARLTNDVSYTAVSYGDTSTGSEDLGVFQQDQSEVETGSARFRLINTVDTDIITGVFRLDVRYNDSDDGVYFATGLGLGDATDYQTTDAGSLNLVVARNSSEPEEEIDRVDCSLNGGRAYDVILAVSDPLNVPTDIDAAEGELVIYCHPHERI
ncbi:MAG TPA: hypothetical protein VFX91_09710 [Alcanivorax sp.]|nr:hypothetical protein [Alcanivorax sp.]